MVDIVGDDLTIGDYIKWYLGGVYQSFSHTVSGDEETATMVDIPDSGTAAYGSVVGTVNGTVTAFLNYQTGGDAATDTTGTQLFGYSGIAADDVLEVYYVEIGSSALTHHATCDKVSPSKSADKKTYSVFGQKNKITVTGSSENTVSMSGLFYDQTFRAAVFGDQVTGSPIASKKTFTDQFSGFNSIGALVGKKYNTSGTLIGLIYLIGVKANSFSEDLSAGAEAATESVDFSYRFRVEVDLS